MTQPTLPTRVSQRVASTLARRPFGWLLRAAFGAASGEPILRDQIQRILVIRNDQIGDFVLTTPFLRELRRLFPGAAITLIVKPAVLPLARLCPYVNEVLAFDCGPATLYDWPGRRERRAWQFAKERLSGTRFDLALVPRGDVDLYGASMLARASGARWRLGHTERLTPQKAQLNPGYDALFTQVIPGGPLVHEAEVPLALLDALGGSAKDSRLEIWTSSEDEGFGVDLLKDRPGPVIALAPGAGEARRRWPVDRFAAVAASLGAQTHGTCVVLGDASDQPAGETIRHVLPDNIIDLTGRATLPQTAAVLRRATLFIGCDSGPLHLAAAAGVPVVEISCHPRSGDPGAYQSPVRFGPWGVPRRVLQPARARAPCRQSCFAAGPHCILDVSEEQVTAAGLELLSETATRMGRPEASAT